MFSRYTHDAQPAKITKTRIYMYIDVKAFPAFPAHAQPAILRIW